MRTIGYKAREMISELSREDKLFLGGIPFTSELDREVENYERYINREISPRQRISLGFFFLDTPGRVIGYHSSSIMNQASPTKYEKENIGLVFPLDYVQGKKIAVSKHWRRGGVGKRLFQNSLDLSISLGKSWVTDVRCDNEAILKFLESQGIRKQSTWYTPKGTKMYRMSN